MQKEFLNPWPLPVKYDKTTHGRITADIPMSKKAFWRQVDPINGAQQTTINILLDKLFNELTKLGYTNSDSVQDARSFIANLVFVDGRTGNGHGGTAVGAVPVTTAPSLGRGTSGESLPNQGATNQRSDVSSRTRGGKAKRTGKQQAT